MKQPRSAKSVFFQAWDQERWIQIAFFAIVVSIGVASRFWLVDWPNVKPVAALVLFSAFFFRRISIALLALVLIMVISDLSIGAYDWRLMASVYLSLAVAAGLGCWVKLSVSKAAPTRMGVGQIGRFTIASLIMSTVFFALTNGAVWWFGQWYPASLSGLASCYAAGLPFYRATMMGDLFFTGVLVGGYMAMDAICERAALWQGRVAIAISDS